MVTKEFKPTVQRQNANRHTQRGMGLLEKSIAEDGWIGAITVAADGETFDGSARLEVNAANFDGVEPIIVRSKGDRPIIHVREDIPTADDPRAVKLGVAANAIANINLAWEPAVLTAIATEGVALDGMFTPLEWADVALQTDTPEPGNGGDEFDTTPDDGPTRTNLGELWVIGGKHRLIVGDSTDAATVARLMDGERANMVFQDPPYNLGSENELIAAPVSSSMRGLKDNDWDKNFDLRPALDALLPSLAADVTVYVCTSHHLAPVIWQWMKEWSDYFGWCVWAKPNPMPSLMKRHWTWSAEIVCYATRGRHTFNFPLDGHALNVWTIPKHKETDHETEKPVAVPERAIKHSSKSNDLIVDLFGGSGTTLVAAHRTGRRAYLCELLPKWADVILKRAEAEGLTVERIEQ